MSKVVFITGGSRGIGHETALHLAGRGFTVVATLRGEAGREALAAAGVEIEVVDVTQPNQIRAAIEATVARHGRLDAVVANAGQGLFGCFEDIDEAQVRALFELNVFGVMHTARAALPHLRASRGRLVIVGSIAGRRSAPGSSVYNATKFALEGWAEAIRFELEAFGVPVVTIEPGPTRSGFGDAAARGERVGQGAYAAITERLLAVRDSAMGEPEPSQTVALAIERVITAKHPPLRVPTGSGTAAQILAARVLPWGVYERIVQMKLKLPRCQVS